MKGIVLSLFLLVLPLSGCLGEDVPDKDQVRVGDEFEYRLKGEVTFRWRIASVETLEFIGRSPCTGLVIERASSTSAGESRFCLDQTFHNELVRDGEHPDTGDMIRAQFFGGSLGVFETIIICAIACEKYAQDMKWQWEHPPSQSGEGMIESLGNKTYVHRSVLLHRGTTEFRNVTFDFNEGKWPSRLMDDRVYITPDNDEGERRFEQTLVWTHIDEEAGRGEPVLFSKADEGVFSSLEGSSWTQFPRTADAPFDYTIEEAFESLQANVEGLLWLNDHPDAFVAAARYGVWQDVDEPDRWEYTWNLLWADGQDRLAARCHRLVYNTPVMDLTTDESCWQLDSFREVEAIHRSDYTERTLDWGDLYDRWEELSGETLPINDAYWTVYDEPPEIGSISETQSDVRDRFTAAFNFYQGTFNSVTDSPNWVVVPPGGQSHGHPVAASIFDPANGRPYLVSAPLD